MRSDTLVSLTEFGEFLGLDPYLVAQVRYDADSNGDLRRHNDSDCEVFVEYAWQKDPTVNDSGQSGLLSRQMLSNGLRYAEQIFEMWTGHCVAPKQILDEYQKHKPAKYRTTERGYRIHPQWSRLIVPGVWTYTAIDDNDVTLTRVDGNLLDTFTATFTVPSGTDADDVLVYLTSDDGGYSGTPTLEHEIRPVDISISGTTATLSAPAYLFVKPEHYEQREPNRLAHVADTYVSDVAIYIRSVDDCQHGTFRLKETQTANLPYSTRSLYLEPEHGQQQDALIPHTIECVDDVQTKYSNNKRVLGFTVNYIAGFDRINRRVDPLIKNIICKIATAVLKIDLTDTEMKRRYGCNGLFLPKLREYQDVPVVQVSDPALLSSGKYTGGRQQILVPQHVMDRLNGQIATHGIVEAYHDCVMLGIARF